MMLNYLFYYFPLFLVLLIVSLAWLDKDTFESLGVTLFGLVVTFIAAFVPVANIIVLWYLISEIIKKHKIGIGKFFSQLFSNIKTTFVGFLPKHIQKSLHDEDEPK